MLQVLSTLDDASRLKGVVVVIDVFRSSNTIIELLHLGAQRVLPVAEEQAARDFKARCADVLLLGERGGQTLEGMDGGNSPTEAASFPVVGKDVVLTTSGGTRAMARCAGEHPFIVGGFVNAAAVARYVRASDDGAFSFWAVGQRAEEPAAEDVECARYLQALAAGEPVDFESVRQALLHCPGADRLREFEQADDLDYCLSLDTRAVVPVGRITRDGQIVIEGMRC